jgi:hypothetical protein
MRRLTKAESRERWSQARALWNDGDPTGVFAMSNWPPDEYESYVGPTLRLLEKGASLVELTEYLESVAGECMGLSAAPEPEEFAMRCRQSPRSNA